MCLPIFRVLFGVLGFAILSSPSPAQLIVYYSFDDGSSPTNGNGPVGTVVNATHTQNGRSGGAYTFNGTDAYIELSTLDINSYVFPRLTMGAWVLATDVSPVRQIISHDDGGLDRSVGLDSRSGVNGWSAFGGSGWVAGETAFTGVWTFIAVSYDYDAAVTTLWVNDRSYTLTESSTGSGWGFTRIGMNPSFGEYFAGSIDEVFFFSDVLTGAQLERIRNQGVMAAVPEPSSLGLMAVGLAALGWYRRQHTRRCLRKPNPSSVPSAPTLPGC